MKKSYFHEIIFSRLALGIFLIVVLVIMGFSKQLTVVGILDNRSKITLPDGRVILAEVADTAEERIKGLSNRDKLDYNSAMLFVFDNESYHSFWMPNMNFAIDIVWLDSDCKIVDVAEDVQPVLSKSLDQAPRYINQTPARYVLEFNAGFCAEHNLVNGDYVELMS